MAPLDAIVEQIDVPQISSSFYGYESCAVLAFGLYAMARGSKRNSQRTAQNRVARRRITFQAAKNKTDQPPKALNDDPYALLAAYQEAQHYTDNPGFRPALYRQVNPYRAVTPDVHWYDEAIDKALSFPKWLFSRDKYEGSVPSDPVNDLHPENVKRSLVYGGLVLAGTALISTALWYGLVVPSLER